MAGNFYTLIMENCSLTEACAVYFLTSCIAIANLQKKLLQNLVVHDITMQKLYNLI